MQQEWQNRKEISSLRSRRLEVVGERENGRARGRHACLLLARPFFLVPTTSKRLLRRLRNLRILYCNNYLKKVNAKLRSRFSAMVY